MITTWVLQVTTVINTLVIVWLKVVPDDEAAWGPYLEELADEAGSGFWNEVGDIETARQGTPEGVPGVPWEGLEGGVPHQHLKDEDPQGPVVCCLGGPPPHDHLWSLDQQTDHSDDVEPGSTKRSFRWCAACMNKQLFSIPKQLI